MKFNKDLINSFFSDHANRQTDKHRWRNNFLSEGKYELRIYTSQQRLADGTRKRSRSHGVLSE